MSSIKVELGTTACFIFSIKLTNQTSCTLKSVRLNLKVKAEDVNQSPVVISCFRPLPPSAPSCFSTFLLGVPTARPAVKHRSKTVKGSYCIV